MKTRLGDELIRSGEILWIGAEDYCIRLQLSGKDFLANSSMNRMAALLDPAQFVRVHRSTIVNLDAVKRMETTAEGVTPVRLEDGAVRRVSRSGRRRLEEVVDFLG